jgi:hypothetical protein
MESQDAPGKSLVSLLQTLERQPKIDGIGKHTVTTVLVTAV